MAGFEASGSSTINSRFKSEVTSSNPYDERNHLLAARDRDSGSPEVIRPCYYLLQIDGFTLVVASWVIRARL